MKKSILLILSFFLAVTLSAQDISSALRQAQARFESGNETGGIELVNKFIEMCGEDAVVEKPATLDGRTLIAMLSSKVKK